MEGKGNPKRRKSSKKLHSSDSGAEEERTLVNSSTAQVRSKSQESRRKTLEFLRFDDDPDTSSKEIASTRNKGSKVEETHNDKGRKSIAKKKSHDDTKSKVRAPASRFNLLSPASETMFFGLKKKEADEANLEIEVEQSTHHRQRKKSFDDDENEERKAKKVKKEKVIQSMKNAGRPKQKKFDWLFRPSELNLFRSVKAEKEMKENEDEGSFQFKYDLDEQARNEKEEREREARRLSKAAHRRKKVSERQRVDQGLKLFSTESNPKVHKRNGRTPDDIFGYQSILHSTKQHVFEMNEMPISLESETELTETDGEKGMTWLIELSASEEQKTRPGGDFEPKAQNSAESSLWLFWSFIRSGGRMPFHFVKNLNSEKSELTYQMKKNELKFYAFVISTLFLVFLTAVSFVNLFLIIMEEEVKGEPHNQIEKLLFEKNKVTAIIFLASLALASISSINVLIHANSIAEYMTLWAKTLNEFNSKSSTGILAVTIVYIVWSISIFVVRIPIVWLTISDAKPNPITEGLHLLTAIVFRSFVPNVLIQIEEDPDSHVDIQSSDQLWKYGVFIVCLNAYALYCSMNFVILVVLYSIGIRNMATEWNFRLRLIFRQTDINQSEHFLLKMSQSLTYQKMFDWHRKIVDLVNENTNVFGVILITFYLANAFVLAAEVIDLAIYTVGEEQVKFNLNESAQPYDFDKDSNHFMYLCFHMFQTIGIFLFVSFFLAETSIVVMDGLIPVTRHNYMNIISAHRRNFFMSLRMSFSARKPHSLGAGGIFSIDRPFILGFLAFFMYFFSVMIQTHHPRILTVPIVLQCPPDSSRFCVVSKLTTVKDIDSINSANAAAVMKYKLRLTNNSVAPTLSSLSKAPTTIIILTTTTSTSPVIVTPPPPTTTTEPPTTTTKTTTTTFTRLFEKGDPDSCRNLPSHSNEDLVAVKVDVGSINYVFCCYKKVNYTGSSLLPECNESDKVVKLQKCSVDPKNRYIFPYLFNDLDQHLRACMTHNDGTCDKANRCFCGLGPEKPIIPKSGDITCS